MSRHLIFAVGVLATALSLAACKPAPTPNPIQTNDEVSATDAELAPPLTPAGTPVAVAAANNDPELQSAANVVQVEDFSEQPLHLFGVSDPTSNSIHIYARLSSGGDGWAVYPVAEAFAYEVVSVQPGKIGIKLTDLSPAPEGGGVDRKIIFEWTDTTDNGVPTSVTITPAA